MADYYRDKFRGEHTIHDDAGKKGGRGMSETESYCTTFGELASGDRFLFGHMATTTVDRLLRDGDVIIHIKGSTHTPQEDSEPVMGFRAASSLPAAAERGAGEPSLIVCASSDPATEPGSLVDELMLITEHVVISGPTRREILEATARHEAAWQARLRAAEKRAEDYKAISSAYSRTIDQVCRERDELAAFKAYVHDRLDAAGIPTHPDGPHGAVGCRVGDRLDAVIGERAQSSVSEWKVETGLLHAAIASEKRRADAAEGRVKSLENTLSAIGTSWADHNNMIHEIIAEISTALPATSDDDAEPRTEPSDDDNERDRMIQEAIDAELDPEHLARVADDNAERAAESAGAE